MMHSRNIPMRTTSPITRLAAYLAGALAVGALVQACSTDAAGPEASPAAAAQDLQTRGRGVQIVRASGADVADAVAQYRVLLGDPNNGVVAGEKASGRREINWDGVPAAVTNTDAFPANFFNVNSPRGLVTSTSGTGFRVSSTNFADVNASYADEFTFFSPVKTFAAVGSEVTELHFFAAGSTTPAAVTGFGAVFSDVDRNGHTLVEYFDATGKRLLKLHVPSRTDAAGLSFAGATFPAPVVATVRITSGQGPLGATVQDVSDGGKDDLVVLDDFLYGEPHAVAAVVAPK